MLDDLVDIILEFIGITIDENGKMKQSKVIKVISIIVIIAAICCGIYIVFK